MPFLSSVWNHDLDSSVQLSTVTQQRTSIGQSAILSTNDALIVHLSRKKHESRISVHRDFDNTGSSRRKSTVSLATRIYFIYSILPIESILAGTYTQIQMIIILERYYVLLRGWQHSRPGNWSEWWPWDGHDPGLSRSRCQSSWLCPYPMVQMHTADENQIFWHADLGPRLSTLWKKFHTRMRRSGIPYL